MSKRYTEEQNKQWQASLPKKTIAVKVVLKSDKGNILLVKPDYKDTWQLPGGGVEEYEDPKVAAIREAEEETGIKIDIGDLRLVDSIFKAKQDYLFLLFECTKLYTEDADYGVEDEEIEEYKFVHPTEVASLLPGYYTKAWNSYTSAIKKPTLEVRIEPVKRSDIEELADLAARTFSDAFGQEMNEADLAQTLAEDRSTAYFEKALEDCKILVAKHQGKIAGYVQYGKVKIPEAEAAETDRELGRLYIDTDLQGQGIGRRLMDAALSDPEMEQAPNIFLQVWDENAKAIALYESYGFERCGVTRFELAGKPAQDLIMVKRQLQEGI